MVVLAIVSAVFGVLSALGGLGSAIVTLVKACTKTKKNSKP